MSNGTVLTDHRKGLLCAALGGFVISWDIPFIRLADSDPWSTLLVRGPFAALALLTFALLARRLKWSSAKIIDGHQTFVFGVLHAIVTMGFVMGIYTTTTANLVFIVAFSPLLALIFSTIFLGERHGPLTWASVVVALGGILLITLDDLIHGDGGNLFGNGIALLTAIVLAIEVIYVRRSGKNLVFAVFLAPLITALVALPIVLATSFNVGNLTFLILNGILITPVAGALLTLSGRYISAPETAMFYLLETVLAPIYVWIIFVEIPTTNTMIGGAIIIAAIAFHSAMKIGRAGKAASI